MPRPKLYLAGPMTGYPEDNRPRFNQLARVLRDRGFDVVNPAEFDQDQSYDVLIHQGLAALRDPAVIGVATHGRHLRSKGARGEVAFARFWREIPVHSWWAWTVAGPNRTDWMNKWR